MKRYHGRAFFILQMCLVSVETGFCGSDNGFMHFFVKEKFIVCEFRTAAVHKILQFIRAEQVFLDNHHRGLVFVVFGILINLCQSPDDMGYIPR